MFLKLNLLVVIVTQFTDITALLNCYPLILTPYIESQRFDELRRLSSVQYLPNAPKLESYSGYLTVNKQFNSNLFFWFFPALKNAESAPVVLWLQGGPGSSSMFSVFLENGPYVIDKDMRVSFNNYSWIQEFSMLYIDNPIGSGFSFTNDKNGFSRDQENIADNLYEALQQFFTIFDDYRKNDFYITGESYAGKYIPAIGYKLHSKKNNSNINFKGIAIGNGWIDPINMLDYGSYLKSIGLIDENQMNYFYYLQNETVSEILKGNFLNANKIGSKILVGNKMTNTPSYFKNITGLNYILNFLLTEPPLEFEYHSKYLNLNRTRDALHVGRITYIMHNSTVNINLLEDIFKSVKPWFTALINNYKVLLYNGNLDIIVALPLTENFLKNLDWKYSKEFETSERSIWKVMKNDKEIAGYAKHFANFTQVVVRNAGHIVPFDQPRAAFDMIKRFVKSQPFDQINE